MELKELTDRLQNDVDKEVMSSMTLFQRFRFMDERSRLTGAYFDPRYIPFYYHFGKYIFPKTMLHAGFGLGLVSGVLLDSCKSVERFLAFQNPRGEYYSPRLAVRNIKDRYKKQFNLYVGAIDDDGFTQMLNKEEWDLIIHTELISYDEHRSEFDILWEQLVYDGLFVIDHLTHEPCQKAFEDFCKIVNREPIIMDTRYGVAIIKK